MKKCSNKKCENFGIFLSLDNFDKDKYSKDGLTYQCKECRKKNSKIYYKNNKQKCALATKIWKEENKDYFKEKRKQYRLNNLEKIRQYERRRLIEKPEAKIAKNLRIRLRDFFRGDYKSGSAINHLGCSIEELKKHLESKFYDNPKTNEPMTWDNYGLYGWHIDHIVPLISFNLLNKEEFSKACHYTNLQPLWAEENWRKHAKQ